MRILVTGARGKVGAAAVAALTDAGHEITATDLGLPVFEARPDGVPYIRADLTDAGDAFAVVRGHDAVVHAAAIPDPISSPPHRVFQNNLMAIFNTLEAAVRSGAARFVNLSSETVPGFIFPERPWVPDYLPVDEQHPIRPQDPYATAKHFGEQLMDRAVRLSDITCVSLRPSWVQWDEVVYIAAPDIASHESLATLARRFHGEQAPAIRSPEEPGGSAISSAKARRLLGYDPRRSWRDYLNDSGRLHPEVRECLERGETGVQRGRRLTGGG
ncbi:MAG TPA: NAD(P)-dependent oxidoreductase [Candidatus Limnocylindrales bacterium]|nr:NAD(P)-dependent oxidoreductase [Candidatus Limnocylindrales bacterium]